MNQKFTSRSLFEYNRKKKIINACVLSILIFLIVLIGIFFPFLKNSFLNEKSFYYQAFNFIILEIKNHSSLGLFITSFFGGLFFFVFPLEIYFYSILKINSNFITSVIPYFLGLLLAQMLNYWIGLRMSNVTKIFIPPKKFYKLKGYLNRWGIWMIIIVNLVPLPSPVFSAVLGSFRYNFKRFILFMALGSISLYSVLFLSYQILN